MLLAKMCEIIDAVQKARPLIHCITNPISINQCANTILCAGARPIMAEYPDEVAQISSSAQALLLNLGGINNTKMKAMKIAVKSAKKENIPFVFDLVGIACSDIRRKFTHKLLKHSRPCIIKGNYSEILALCDLSYRSSGVDADRTLDKAYIAKCAIKLAKLYNTTVLASGKTDIIAGNDRLIYADNGTDKLSTITGTGCMLGALCAAYASACPDIEAAVCACVTLGVCAEKSTSDKGAGTFMVNLFDRLSTFTCHDLQNYQKVEEINIESI